MHQPPIQPLESRRLLAADVSLVGDTLTITGTDGRDAVHVGLRRVADGTESTVRDGGTLLRFDDDALADAGLDRDGGRAAQALRVTRDSDFRYDHADGTLTPLSGEIVHRGRVSFNGGDLVVGGFTIAYDAARAAGEASGYFVSDTLGDAGVLFDLGSVDATAGARFLRLADADLLVAPELAATLGDASLVGADVGDAGVFARSIPDTIEQIVVRTGRDAVATFDPAAVANLDVTLGGGRDRLAIGRLDLTGTLTVDAGAGDDHVAVYTSQFAGGATLVGGEGRDRLVALRSSVVDDDADGFERVFIA